MSEEFTRELQAMQSLVASLHVAPNQTEVSVSTSQSEPAPSSPKSVPDPVVAQYPSNALDMLVDPNEPTYCLCQQVAYGVMIGCDNPNCPIEWFHFACVGLTTNPKGKWFCPECS